MRQAAILAFCAALALPALAAEGGQKGGKPGTNVDMPYLMAPLTGADGKLAGYFYIVSRLTASSESIVTDVREKLPYIQDAFVRDVNGATVAMPDAPQAVDIPGLEARMKADAAKVMGTGKVKLITICSVQVAPLHPVQVPNAPPEGAAKGPEKSRCES
ncbi:MAG TPA: hypothetical protein VG821_01910 [Rhizomicrobium sp.]|jgi:hypothetical protein|nr:hypothetical protein [Rhizomicrobium sp.]